MNITDEYIKTKNPNYLTATQRYEANRKLMSEFPFCGLSDTEQIYFNYLLENEHHRCFRWSKALESWIPVLEQSLGKKCGYLVCIDIPAIESGS